MRIRIDLKILIYLILFYLTNQINIYLTILFFCILHELGHILVGLVLGLKTNKIEIMPYGLSVELNINPKDINRKIGKGTVLELKKIIVFIAGPLVSLILAIVSNHINYTYIAKQDAIYSNILILLFNLIPLYPLDGGRIIKEILHIKFGNIISKKITNTVSNITMIIFTFICSIAVLYFKNIAYFLICIILWIITIQENKKFSNDMKLYEIFRK